MRRTLLTAVIGLLFSVPLATAQEQRGSIEGVIRDSSGGILPGVTVETRSPALVGASSAVTDSQGVYRFPSLPPGVYEVTATLSGFGTAKAANVRLELGQILKVDLTLAVAGIAETVQVSGESPIIDVKQNAAGANIQSEIIDRIPKGRDFTSVITVAPSIDNESARNFGISIDGASGADNRFFVDGVDQTDMQRGTSLAINSAALNTSAKTVANDFLEQVQVKASGYNAEYRASIGGVISAVTRSGSNAWRGSFGGYYTSDGLQGDVRPTLQLNPTNQTIAEYVKAPPDRFKNGELVADVGGPILHDRLWFYGGYNPQSTKTSRTVVFRSNRALGPQTYTSDPVDQIVTYNVTGQITTNLRGKFAANNERVRGGRGLPNIQTDGTSTSNPSLFPSPTWLNRFKDSYSGVVDWVASPHTYVNLTSNFLTYGGHDMGSYSTALVHTFSGSNIPTSPSSVFNDIPSSLQNVNGYSDNPSNSRQVEDTFDRFGLNGDVTRYLTWHGSHMVKAGVQFEHITNVAQSGQQAPNETFFWGASYATTTGGLVKGRYGYYLVSRRYTQGDVSANNTSLFAQDAWSPTGKLTLNLGLRLENEHVPSYRPENPGVYFGFGSKVGPRLGFAYDVTGDSTWKAYGSWGMFYDVLKLTIGRVMFGADRWVSYYYTLDTYDWPAINCDYPPSSGPNCPGTYIAQFDNRSVANDPSLNLVDPNLRPTQTEEFTLGVDHELNKTMSVGVRFVRKWADYVIESVCQFVPAGEACGVNNPGFGTIGKHPVPEVSQDQPPAKRVYDGIEFRLRKRYANRWSLDASYLYSRLWGNWSGVGSSDEAVNCLQANSCLAFNFLYYSYDASGRPTYGLLGTDRPNQFKTAFTYDLPWGTLVGVNQIAESGIPQSTIIKERTDGLNFFPYGRGDLGRTPFYTQTDLLAQQRIPLPGSRVHLVVGANVINLFDQKRITLKQTTPYRDAFSVPDVQFFAGFDPVAYAASTPGIRVDPRFGQASQFQPRRAITMQAKITF